MKMSLARLRKLHQSVRMFMDERHLLGDSTSERKELRHFVHFWMVVCKSFARNRCPLRASALAYTSILSLIPILAVSVSISTALLRGNGAEWIDKSIDYLIETIAPQLNLVEEPIANPSAGIAAPGEESESTTNLTLTVTNTTAVIEGDVLQPAHAGRDTVASNIKAYINNINTSGLGILAVAALILVGVSLLITIEVTFNDIWGAKKGRSVMARILRYWTTISLAPVCVVTAMAMTTASQFQSTSQWLTHLPFLGDLFLRLLPFLVVSLVFSLLYWQVPNTHVDWKGALVGGFVGGTLWLLNQQMGVLYATKVVTYSKIYGSLGIIPIFLVGIYFSWLILLFGAQVAHTFQNRKSYLAELRFEALSPRGLEFGALLVMALIGRHYREEEPAPDDQDISVGLDLPAHLVSQVLQPLLSARLILQVGGTHQGYVPARPLEQITCEQILESVRTEGGKEIEIVRHPGRQAVRAVFSRIYEAEAALSSSVTLEDLVGRMDVATDKAKSELEIVNSPFKY